MKNTSKANSLMFCSVQRIFFLEDKWFSKYEVQRDLKCLVSVLPICNPTHHLKYAVSVDAPW